MSVPLLALQKTVAHSYMQLVNYLPFEEQIQLRPTAPSTGKVPLRRLARLVAAKVRSCLKVCIVPIWIVCRSLMPFEQKAEEQNSAIADWKSPRWIFGSSAGCIRVSDIILLGVVFVSPGKITPLLQVRSDYGEWYPITLMCTILSRAVFAA